MVSPITVATQGLLNSPLAVAAVRGRLSIALLVEEEVRGGSSDPALIAKAIAPRVVDPVLRAKLLREDEEIMVIILAIVDRLDE
jgi:hypothetical protein